MVLGGMAALALPETLGRSLPQSLEDAEEFRVDCSAQSCCPRRQAKVKLRKPRVSIQGASEEEDEFIQGRSEEKANTKV